MESALPVPCSGRTPGPLFLLVVVSALLVTLAQPGGAQLSYRSGQNVSPAYEGWEQNEDGSFNFLFGYMNRNWEEELDVDLTITVLAASAP